MKRSLLLLAALLAWVLAPSGASARNFTLPEVDYSADREVQSGERWQTMVVHYSPGKERMELTGAAARGNVMIVRYDRGVTWVLMPRLGAYLELPNNVGDNISSVMQSLDLQPAGRERIDGVEAAKYRVDGKLQGFMWIGAQGIPLRIDGDLDVDGKTTPAHLEQHNVVVAPQAAELFELPGGLARIELKDARWLGLMQQYLTGK
jgi:hypothetical protein